MQEGPQARFDALVSSPEWSKILGAVRRALRSRVGNSEVDDVVAATALQLVLHAQAGKPVDSWEALAVVVARNVAHDARKIHRRETKVEDLDRLPSFARLCMSSVVDGLVDPGEFVAELRNESQRNIYVLWAAGCPTAEIALRLGKSVAAVQKAILRIACRIAQRKKSAREASEGETL
jgi:DNA-directed RNA polymerase specialized sigma24 family protein